MSIRCLSPTSKSRQTLSVRNMKIEGQKRAQREKLVGGGYSQAIKQIMDDLSTTTKLERFTSLERVSKPSRPSRVVSRSTVQDLKAFWARWASAETEIKEQVMTILITLSLLIPILAIAVGSWMQYRKANPKAPSATPAPSTTTRKLSLPSPKSIWGFLQPLLIAGILIGILASLFHHASREWIVENVTGVWQRQVQGLHYLTYEISPDLSPGKTKECLEPALYVPRGQKRV